MKQGVKKCSKSEPKCPCYREKDGVKKAFDEGWSLIKEDYSLQSGDEWYFYMETDFTYPPSTEEFGPYDSEEAAHAGMDRVKARIVELDDGIRRVFTGPYYGRQGDGMGMIY